MEFDSSGFPVNESACDAGNHGTHVAGIVSGDTCRVAPGADLAVAAVLTDQNDIVCDFSDWGYEKTNSVYKPDLCALGRDIVSAEANSVNRFVSMSGTSTAAPMVSDASDLLIESNPALATDTQLLRQELLLQVDRSLNHESGNIDQNNLNYSRIGKGKLDIN